MTVARVIKGGDLVDGLEPWFEPIPKLENVLHYISHVGTVGLLFWSGAPCARAVGRIILR